MELSPACEGLHILAYARHLQPLSSGGIFYISTPTVTQNLKLYCLIPRTGNQPAANATQTHDLMIKSLAHYRLSQADSGLILQVLQY